MSAIKELLDVKANSFNKHKKELTEFIGIHMCVFCSFLYIYQR